MLSIQFSQKYAIKSMTHKACYLLPRWAGTPGFYGHMVQRTWPSEWSGPGSLLPSLLSFSHHMADMTFSLALGNLCVHLPLREIACTNGFITKSYLEGINDPSALIKRQNNLFGLTVSGSWTPLWWTKGMVAEAQSWVFTSWTARAKQREWIINSRRLCNHKACS